MAKCANRRLGVAGLLVCLMIPLDDACAANVLVPSFDLITRGAMSGNSFVLVTLGQMDIAFDGGYKFGGNIAFEYANPILEQPIWLLGLAFKKASVTVKELFALPLAFCWFVGRNDLLCEGDAFGLSFGTVPIMTKYRGYMYFPSGTVYDGIHEINGTGFRIDVSPIPESLIVSLYGYEDTSFLIAGPIPTVVLGLYSTDLRVLADFGSVKMEAFFGATYVPSSLYGYYRGGFLFYVSGGDMAEFLAQIGVPRYDPGADPAFSIDLFYLLFEPRLHMGIFSITPTFFWHPGYYHQAATGETGSFDVNLDLSLGDIADFGMRGGLESNFRFISSTNAFGFVESPYVSFAAMGMLWDVKCDIQLGWPLTLNNFSGMIGIKAEF